MKPAARIAGNNKRHIFEALKQTELESLLTKIANAAPVAIHKFRIGPDGKMSMPYSTPAIADVYGMTPEEIQEDFAPAWRMVHPDDRRPILKAIDESMKTMEPFECEWRVQHPTKGEIWVDCRSTPEREPDGGVAWYGYFHDITAQKQAERERLTSLHFFEHLDQINRAIHGSNDLEQMMSEVLESLLDIFGCDRVWLLYPCDPGAETWRIPMECTRPEYPGLYAAGKDCPMDPYVARNMEIVLQTDDPVGFGPGQEYPFPGEIPGKFNIQSSIAMAMYPKIGKPWMFGLHQCSHQRIWTTEDRRLFSEISRRMSDGLTSLLVSRDLQESEERFRQAFEFAGIGMGILSVDGRWLRANHAICEMLGYTEEELLQTTYQELTHPDDLVRGKEDVRRVIAGEIPCMQIEKRYRHCDGHYLWASLTTSVVRSHRNEPLYFVSQIENIDQRKRTQQHLSLLSFALNRVKEGVYLIDEDAQLHYVNDEACRALGYSREELLNMSVYDIDPDYQMSRWRDHWKEIKAKGSVILETIHKTKNGEIYPAELNANYFEFDGYSYNLVLERNITERKQTEEALRQSEADLQLALDAGRLGDWKWNIVTGEVTWSQRCKALYGLPPDTDVSYEQFLSLVHPEDRKKVETSLQEAVETGGDYELEKRIIRPDGSLRWTVARAKVFYDTNGQAVLMAGVTMDITERKLSQDAQYKAEEALKESDERFRQMAENIQEIFWFTDVKKQQMLYVSPAYETIWGESRKSLYYKPMRWLDAIHPEDRQRVEDAIERQASGDYDIEYRIFQPDGTMRYIHDRAFPVRDRTGEVYRVVGIAQDITARKEQEAHIQYLAYHDALTGLPNRSLVMNRLDQAIIHAQRHKQMLAVLFFDLDRFKTINDTLGHPAGDGLLQQAGKCLIEVLRDDDTVGRVGGDEFLILLPELSTPDDAAHVTEKILQALSAPFNVSGYNLHVSASIGISMYPRDTEDPETLVKYADTALYLAKEQGRNTFRFFSPELDAKVHARLHLENALRSAIERNELVLHYQPIVDVATGKVTGAEALIRWQHPEYGLVATSDFISIAEETGLIIPIGEWVLRTVGTQARAWQEAGFSDFRVSVNLSRRQLEQPDLAANIHRILNETGCDTHLIELEVTESSAMYDPEQAIVKLQSLHEMGLQLALDDFGTGYSSLAYLKRFSLDRLKIDKSFVSGIPEDSDDMVIVQTTIMMARQLRLKVIAEGVETEAQHVFLKANGCDEMQGYLLGKAMSSSELENLRCVDGKHTDMVERDKSCPN